MFEPFVKRFSNYLVNNSLKHTNKTCIFPKISVSLAKAFHQGKVAETNLKNYPVVSKKHSNLLCPFHWKDQKESTN